MEISFRSHLDSNTVIATKFCTCHDSYAVVSCARICCDLMASNGITERRNFHCIWIVGKKSVVKGAPVPVNYSRSPTRSCWSGRRSVPGPLVARRCPCCRAPDLHSSSRAPRSSCWASIVWNPPEQPLKNFNKWKHRYLNKMVAIFTDAQTTYSNEFSWMKMFTIWFQVHWKSVPRQWLFFLIQFLASNLTEICS